MKCHGCGSPMRVDHCEHGPGARACWHQCTLCGKVRLVSQPAMNVGPNVSANEYADEFDAAIREPMPET